MASNEPKTETGRPKLLGIGVCAALRGLGKLGYSGEQGKAICSHFGIGILRRTVLNQIRAGKASNEHWGPIPNLSTRQIEEVAKICGRPGKEQEKPKTVAAEEVPVVSLEASRVRAALA